MQPENSNRWRLNRLMTRFAARTALRTAALAALAFAGGNAPAAPFPVAVSSAIENDSAIAVSTLDRTMVVAYLDDGGGGGPSELAIRRHQASGAVNGAPLYPFASGYVALGRPDIAWNPQSNSYLVAVPDSTASGARVRAMRLASDGTPQPQTEVYPLQSGLGLVAAGDGNAPLRVTANPLDGSFLITFQLAFINSNQLWAQVLAPDGTLGTPYQVGEFGTSEIFAHSVAFAPQLGGRYLVAYHANGLHLKVLNAAGEPQLVAGPSATGIPNFDEIPFDYGHPDGANNESSPDVAYGRVRGVDTWVVVWADGDNCEPNVEECASNPDDQWTGVWGGFLDPTRTFWPDDASPSNVPFPISKIGVHYPLESEYKPRVHYSSTAQRFFVAWREVPFDSMQNDESRSHIRLGQVVEHVADGALETPMPPDNAVMSPVSGSCTSPNLPCLSDQDPDRPDIAPSGDQGAVVVWHQNWPPNPADKDVYGNLYRLPPPSNDSPAGAPPVGNARAAGRAAAETTTFGATTDVTSSCSSSGDDVWYLYTAPAFGELDIDTCGSHDLYGIDTNLDTVLSLHDPQTYAELAGACNDDTFGSCGGADLGLSRDSRVSRAMAPGETVAIRVGRYIASPAGDFALNIDFQASASGKVDGLRVENAPGGQVRVTWGPSCAAGDAQVDLYEGQLGQFASHVPVVCGATGSEWTFAPAGGARYFLAVPSDGTVEGSYGTDSAGFERPRSAQACRVAQQVGCS